MSFPFKDDLSMLFLQSALVAPGTVTHVALTATATRADVDVQERFVPTDRGCYTKGEMIKLGKEAQARRISFGKPR